MKYFTKLAIAFFFICGFLQSGQAQQVDGLLGAYYNGIDFDEFVLKRFDKTIYLNGVIQSPAPNVNGEYFSIRWTGKIFAPSTGEYTFHVHADDGVRLWV